MFIYRWFLVVWIFLGRVVMIDLMLFEVKVVLMFIGDLLGEVFCDILMFMC